MSVVMGTVERVRNSKRKIEVKRKPEYYTKGSSDPPGSDDVLYLPPIPGLK